VVSVTPRPRFSPGERNSGTHCTGGWVDPTAGLDTEARGKTSCLCRGSNLDRPVVQSVADNILTNLLWLLKIGVYQVFIPLETDSVFDMAQISRYMSKVSGPANKHAKFLCLIHGPAECIKHSLCVNVNIMFKRPYSCKREFS
jgi:hypothetical protein